MDQDFHTMHFSGQQPASSLAPSALHSQAFPAQQQLPNQTANGGSQFNVPEDVESALRYTPLTSAVPATGVLNVLPTPQFTSFYLSNLIANPERVQSAQDYFALMNRTAHNQAEEAFQREQLQMTLNLLNQVDDRDIRFKTPPHFVAPTPQNAPTHSPTDLGPFAKAVLDKTTNNFRYPTPLTPEMPRPSPPIQQTQPSTPYTIPIPIYDANFRPYSMTTLPPRGSPLRQSVAVEIISRTPNSSMASSHYKPQKVSPQYPHGRQSSTSPSPSHTLVEKDRVDAMISQFSALLEDIFEAEDAFNPEAEAPSEASLAFFDRESLNGERPWLSREVHRKLDMQLRRLGKTNLGKMGSRVETDELSRITSICERAVKAAETIELKDIDDEDDEEDSEREWIIGKLGRVENAILAANVIMLLIAGRGTDQQIYSEETLKSIVEVLRIFLDCIFQWVSPAENTASDTLSVARKCSKQIAALLQNSITLLSQFEVHLGDTVTQESILNVLQFLAVEAIFLENQAKDKEIVISNQGIESLRVISMGVLRQVFASYPEQRSFILDEVLSSLAKLPATRQHARHFKLMDGKSIQLVSALMMRLVQASGACFNVRNIDSVQVHMEDDPDAELSLQEKRVNAYADEWANASKAANQSAFYIVNYLTSRALQTSKTAPTDSPFKALLDIFTEDFLTVLTAPEWPAAELILRSLTKNLFTCIDGDAHGAQVKNVALDAVGQIAAKIKSIRKKLSAQLSTRTEEETDTSRLISRVGEYAVGLSLTMAELSDIQEAYRIVWSKADEGMRDALRFQVCSWANFLVSTDRGEDDEFSGPRRSTPLIEELAKIAKAGTTQVSSFAIPSDSEVSLACTVILTRSPLFQSFDNMLSRILRSMSEKQPTFRTKALRTLGQIIVADPDILSSTNVQQQVALRISDPSPAVREAAIELVAKHIASDPVLGKSYYEVMRGRITDAGLGVRKRVIKLLKDIYLKSGDRDMQSAIASSILSRIADEEHSVRELAIKTMEELWFMPPGEEIDMGGIFDFVRLNIKAQNTIRTRTLAMARVLGDNEERKIGLFRRLLRTMCAETGKQEKSLQSRLDACKLSVHCLYDIALNDASEGKLVNFKRCLLVISLFAKSSPSVFSADHMTSLEPYLKTSADKEDQEIAYLVVVIYRTLLAYGQLTFQPEFLTRAMTTIATGMTSASLKHLKEAVPVVCLIAATLNDYSNIIKVVQTCFRPVKNAEKQIATGGLNPGNTTLIRCFYLLGLFAQHAKIDERREQFNPALGIPKNMSVTTLIAKSLAAFSKPAVPEALRKIAVTSYGFLCLGNTDFFKSDAEDAQQVITSSLRDPSQTLKRTILEIFQEYFATEDHKAEATEGKRKDDVDLTSDIGVLTGTASSINTDEASFFLAGNYLGDIMSCASSDSAPLAIAGTEVFESIVRGGLAAPNDLFPTLVALETSPVARVRQIAAQSRVLLSTRFEDVTESNPRQVMERLFEYRKTVANSPKGYFSLNGQDASALIGGYYADMKTKKKARVRYLRSLVNILDRDSQSRDKNAVVDVEFACFIAENLIYLDYGVIEEVFTVIYTIDRILASTGISILQSIEAGDTSTNIVLLARRSMILSLLVGLKQQLKFQYNLTEAKCRAFDPKKAGNAKDNKQAVKARTIGPMEWEEIPYLHKPFDHESQVREQLEAFVALMRRDEIAGSQEVLPISDDEQQIGTPNDDSATTNGDDDMMDVNSTGTPAKKEKKRKEGSELGSAKKKFKKLVI